MKNEIRTLQSLRFVFVLLIILSHVWGAAFDFGGECGVAFFFILSGFVLSVAYGQKVANGCFPHRKFFRRQLLKFYPLHLLMLVAIVLLDILTGHADEWFHIQPSVLLLQSWIPVDKYYFAANGVAWFLCDILFCYAVFPYLYKVIHRTAATRLLTAAVVVLVLYGLVAVNLPDRLVNALLYVSPPVRLIDFALGVAAHRCYASLEARSVAQWLQRQHRSRLTAIEFALILAIVLLAIIYPAVPLGLRQAALYWPVLWTVIIMFTLLDRRGGLVTHLLQSPPLHWLSTLTLELYLIQLLVIRVVFYLTAKWGLFDGHQPSVAVTVVCVATMIPVAWTVGRLKIKY